MEVGAEEGERLVPDHLGESRVRQDDGPQALQAVAGHQGSLHGELETRSGPNRPAAAIGGELSRVIPWKI